MSQFNSSFSVDDQPPGESPVAVADAAPVEELEQALDTGTAIAAATPGVAGSSDSPDIETVGAPDLLNELARAMHDAAQAQFARMTTELERQRLRQIEAIAGRASAETEDLTAELEADTRAIDAWAKAETEKIRLERMARIDARRDEHADMLQREATIKERKIFAIEVAIDAHRAELDTFFTDLGRATDPARIASVAAAMPRLPSLDEIAEDAHRAASAEFALRDRADDIRAQRTTDDEADVSESRLMAVMDPADASAETADARPWESADARPWEPVALAEVEPAEPAQATESSLPVEASQATEPSETPELSQPSVAPEAEPVSAGSTLLRAIASFRPMASNQSHPTEPPDKER